MSSIFRYLCLAFGVALITAGWLVINSQRIQQATIESMGRVVASRMLAESTNGPARTGACALARPTKADDSGWSFLGPQIGSWMRAALTATTSYLLGVLIIILGAALLGLAVPAGSFGGGEVPRGPGVNWACLLMLGQACLFLCCGFIAYYTSDFRGGHLFLGTRSAAILVSAAALTSFIRHSKTLGLVGYYSGLVLTPVLGLNFLRLALKQPVTLDALNVTVVAKALMTLGSFVAIFLLWRALPGGVDRARLSLQLRRFAAGAGAAVLVAGFCITKVSLLPQQALAEGGAAVILDVPEVGAALAELGVPNELVDAGREKLIEMGAGLEDLESLQAAAAEVLSDWEESEPAAIADERGRELLQTAREVTSAPAAAAGGPNVSDLLNELNATEMQKLLRETAVNADLARPGAVELARQTAQKADANDPRVREALDKLELNRVAPTRNDGAASAGTGNASGARRGGRPVEPLNPNRPRTTRPLPSRIDSRIPDPRLSDTRVAPGERATYRTPRPSSHPPSFGPEVRPVAEDLPPPAAEPQAGSFDPVREPGPFAATEAGEFDIAGFGPASETTAVDPHAWFAPAAIPPDGYAETAPAPPILDDEQNGEARAGTEAKTGAAAIVSAVTSPPPAPLLPPPPPGPDRLSRLQMTISQTANQARGYGLLAMLTGSIVFLAAVLLRRTTRQQIPAQADGSP